MFNFSPASGHLCINADVCHEASERDNDNGDDDDDEKAGWKIMLFLATFLSLSGYLSSQQLVRTISRQSVFRCQSQCGMWNHRRRRRATSGLGELPSVTAQMRLKYYIYFY